MAFENNGDDNSSWDFWDKVYSSRELRQKMEEKTQCEVSMSELLKSANLCRAELTVQNVPRMAPSHENTIRQLIKKDLRIDVPIINMEITPKKWTLRFYRREDASQVLRVLAGYTFRSRVLHVTLHKVHAEVEVQSSLNVDEILPNGLPQTDRNMNWGIVEWCEILEFKNDLCALIRRHPHGIPIEDALTELRVMRRKGLISLALDVFPLGLLRMFSPHIRMTGRYLSLPEQDNGTTLVRLTCLERSPRISLEEWERFPPAEIRSEQQLMEYFYQLLNHFGPQHMGMSLVLRLAVSTISPTYPRSSGQLAKRLVELSHSFILIQDTLYVTTSVRHRRLLLESIAPPPPPKISRIVIKEQMVGRQVRLPEYENWLEDIQKQGGEFNWVMQDRDFPAMRGPGGSSRQRTVSEIIDGVLNSRSVQETIISEASKRRCSRREVYEEAAGILVDMTHQYSLTNVRCFGYAVSKVFNKIFDGIYVNGPQMRKLREISKHSPIVFMPSHRTYMDFLLISLMCFQYEIQLPAIAAGQDFQRMAVMGTVLRNSGAFFMRRSFGKDKLYWAVFTEYVQTHLVHGDRPVEYFVEGTRSRVGKGLHPKYGLIQIAIEPFLRGDVYDMTVVPATMNYDKILEEMLYAYELLGFSKPKESTSGLLKAREVLNKRFGKCFITFGEPISVRQHFGSHFLRNSFVSQPASQFKMNVEARNKIRNFAHEIVRINNANNIITVWPLACLVMLQKLDRDDDSSFRFSEIHFGVEQLIHLLRKLDITVHHTAGIEAELRYYIQLHSDLFRPTNFSGHDFQLRLLDLPVEQSGTVRREIMERAVSRLVLTTYSNLIVETVFEPCYISLIIDSLGLTSKTEIQKEFSFLLHLLKREFVFIPGMEADHFEKAYAALSKAGIVRTNAKGETEVLNEDVLGFLSTVISPYVYHFSTILDTVIGMRGDLKNVSGVVKAAQSNIVRLYELGGPSVRLSFLSTEPIKNSFHTLVDLGALVARESGGFHFRSRTLEDLHRHLSQFGCPAGTLETASFSSMSAKL